MLNLHRQIESGRDDLEPHQIPLAVHNAALDADPLTVADGLLGIVDLLDVNHAALITRIQLAVAVIRGQVVTNHRLSKQLLEQQR